MSPAVKQPLPRRTALRTAAVIVAGSVGAASIAACTASPEGSDAPDADEDDGSQGPDAAGSLVIAADERAGVVDSTTSAHEQSLAASQALLDRAAVVVVASTDADVTAADTLARDLGVPMLVAGAGLTTELDRLRTHTVVRLGAASGPDSVTASEGRTEVDGADTDAVAALPGLPRSPVAHSALVLLPPEGTLPPAVGATVAAAGADRITVRDSDPRLTPDAFEPLAAGTGPTLGLGVELGPAERLTQRIRTVRRAPQLPAGGFLPFPGRRMIALYGHPDTNALGMLGEQPAGDAVRRAQSLADEYAALSDEPVIPAFELIASVASEAAGDDGDYSRRTPIERLLPWVEAAEAAGIYVVIDLQPGRTDFLTQAEHYEPLLRRPFVGLALDPEWRLKPGQRHLRQIGSVAIDEVNRVGAWLAALVREHDLPPKVLTLHQFRPSMIPGRERLDTSLDEVQWLVHADGQGGQGDKQATWRRLMRDLPAGVWLGWKNFEDEDLPMLTPEQTMSQVSPTPWFVSYQ
ncbi:MAG TPA: hypothetical protein VLA55_04935 [Ornithinibacter sp.]|nr:hypothetical protein [Ornithinibacter sp.]